MKKFIIILLLVISVSVNLVYGEGERKEGLNKITGSPNYTFFDINNISTFIYNNGGTDFNLNRGSGFEYPKGSRKALVYTSGLIWGAKVNDEVRVGGSTYNQGLVGGKILPNGTAEDFNAANVRVYRVRRDFLNVNTRDQVDVSSEIFDGQGSAQQIRDQYIKDWNEWPVNDGAPFEDIDGDGQYNYEIDIPGIPGADQTIWYVANDINSLITIDLYGSPSLGIEMQATFWGYKNNTPIDNVMFRRYVIINKSVNTFQDMYLSLWMDPDIGDAQDDLVGCDTVINVGYAYNSTYYDDVYGVNAPAIGFKILQGPIVEGSQNDAAKFFGRNISGMKNLEMTSFHYLFKCCAPKNGDPVLGNYDLGTISWYEYMKGNLRTGEPFLKPERLGGGTTFFPYSGDPVSGNGWLDGVEADPADRRMGVGLGPFTMTPGDTQEVIYAHIAAGGEEGVSSLTAVSLLKQYAEFAQFLYDSDFETGVEITAPSVKSYEMDKTIGLTWGDNSTQINQIENYDKNSFKFQGYNIYQFSHGAEELKDAVRIATFDIIDGIGEISGNIENEIQQFGSDSGIKRSIIIDKDYIIDKPLTNGKKYYFGVTAYAYNQSDTNGINNFESFPQILTVIPNDFSPGYFSTILVNQNLNVEHKTGGSNAEIIASVISPDKLTGNSYQLSFRNNNENYLEIVIKNKDESKEIFAGLLINGNQNQNITFDGLNLEIKNSSANGNVLIPLSQSDIYEFATVEKNYDQNKAVSDAEKINVFPNPYYYKVQSTGIYKYPDEVTFTHLPQRAVIRIFNISGQIVNTISKNSPEQFIKWDLYAKWGRRVAIGLYIIHIELPDIGTTKILKLAVN